MSAESVSRCNTSRVINTYATEKEASTKKEEAVETYVVSCYKVLKVNPLMYSSLEWHM